MTENQPSDSLHVWTVPNILSFARLAGIPLFLYLLLGPHEDGWALTVLALSAITDWADGKLARLLNQYSNLGEMLDSAADRLYILATLVGFVIRGFVPWWVAVIIVGRDLILAVFLPLIRRHGYPPPTVLYLGKAATFALLYALPIILLGYAAAPLKTLCLAVGYAFLIWGIGMYLWVGALYLKQHLWILARTPVVPMEQRPGARELASS
jgi:cardiolipin synthase